MVNIFIMDKHTDRFLWDMNLRPRIYNVMAAPGNLQTFIKSKKHIPQDH